MNFKYYLKVLKNIFTKEVYLVRYDKKIKDNGFNVDQIRLAFDYTYLIPNIKNIFIKNIIFFINVKILNYFRIIVHKFKFFSKKNYKNVNLDVKKLNFQTKDLILYSEFYKKNGYCFVENFLDDNSYLTLLKNWPSEDFFPPFLSPTKFYSFAFGFENQNSKELENLTIDEKIKNVKNLRKSKILIVFTNFFYQKKIKIIFQIFMMKIIIGNVI